MDITVATPKEEDKELELGELATDLESTAVLIQDIAINIRNYSLKDTDEELIKIEAEILTQSENEKRQAKLKFVENLILACSNPKVVEGTKSFYDIKSLKLSLASKRAHLVSAVKNNKVERLKDKYNIDLTGVNKELFDCYFTGLIAHTIDFDSNLFGINPMSLKRINIDIANETDELRRSDLQKVKNALGQTVKTYYDWINNMIDENKLVEIEESMRNSITNVKVEGKERQRNATVVMLNGHTGAGKGTTLKMMEAVSVETGTDGIAGRGEGYEAYEDVMGPFDLARETRQFIPDRVMRILFSAEMLNRRAELDQAGRIDDPIYVSGFPRFIDQVKPFVGIPNMISIALTISSETATNRTLCRVADAIRSGKEVRPDDLSDLATPDGQQADGKTVVNNVKGLLNSIDAYEEEGYLVTEGQIYEAVIKAFGGKYQMHKLSRYFKYDKTIADVSKTIESLGVTTHMIKCEGLSKQQVTDQVKAIITEKEA